MFSNSGSRAIVIFKFQTFCRNRLFNVPAWYMYMYLQNHALQLQKMKTAELKAETLKIHIA